MTAPSSANIASRLAAACLLCFSVAGVAFAQNDETPLDIIAAAVRQNGHSCQSPKSATPDPDHTTPEEKAWIIHCETAAYRVKFLGDQGAEVTPLGE